MKTRLIPCLLSVIILGCQQDSKKEEDTTSTEIVNESAASIDSITVNSIISKLSGIEKYAVKNDYYTLAKLLKFKKEEEHYQGIIKLLGKQVNGYIETLDKKNGFIKYSDFQEGDRVISVTYWNKTDGSKLISSVDAFSDGMALSSSISFELFQDGKYVAQELNQIIPEIDRVYRIVEDAVGEELEFYSNSWRLPNSGKNIQYCLENECIELVWNDGIFLIPPEDKLN